MQKEDKQQSKTEIKKKVKNQKLSISKQLGGILIISGTTIGAGMLALPLASAKLGFILASALMFFMWVFMSYMAIITLEANLYFNDGVSVAKLAKKTIGKKAGLIAMLSLLFLFYSLLSAYTAGGSSIIYQAIKAKSPYVLTIFDKTWLQVIYTIIFGGIVTISMNSVDMANRLMFSIKIILFIAMVFLLFPFIEANNISRGLIDGPESMIIAIPIIFTSFGFHGSIPAIVKYIGPSHHKELKKIFIIGSLIPLVAYILWVFVSIGSIPYHSPNGEEIGFKYILDNNGDLGIFVKELDKVIDHPLFILMTNAFMLLAIITSYFGVGIGLLDLVQESLCVDKKVVSQRLIAAAITFIIPMLFAIFYPDGFVKALIFAAAFLSILAVIIPSMVVMKLGDKSIVTKISLLFGFTIILLSLIYN